MTLRNLAVALGVLLTASSALVAEPTAQDKGQTIPSAKAASVSAEEYCVAQLKPTGSKQPGSDTVEAEIATQRCFNTFTEAIASATAGAVRVASPDELPEERLSPPPEAKGPWAIEYDTYRHEGKKKLLVWTVDGPGCTKNAWTVRQLPPPFNDSIIAVRFGGGRNTTCNYDHGGWWGYVQDCKPNCTSLGEMNGRTSSKIWLRRGECPAVKAPRE